MPAVCAPFRRRWFLKQFDGLLVEVHRVTELAAVLSHFVVQRHPGMQSDGHQLENEAEPHPKVTIARLGFSLEKRFCMGG